MAAPAAASSHGHQPVRAGGDGPGAVVSPAGGGAAARPSRRGSWFPSRPPYPSRRRAHRARRVASSRARPPPGGPAVIRAAGPSDSQAIAAIWNREVMETTATSDTEPRTVEAQQAWLAAHGPRHPVIVAVDGDEVVAFGALSPYRTKPSYAR